MKISALYVIMYLISFLAGGKNMRFLHTADLHLDSSFCKLGVLDAEAQRERQRELLERIFDCAEKNECDMMLIAGDLFDTPVVTHATQKLCLELFERFGKPIFISPGNHDAFIAGGFYKSAALSQNVYVFNSDELQYIDLPELDVTVAGYAFMSQGLAKDPLDTPLRPEGENQRILLLCAHTEIDTPTSRYAPIMLSDIARHGFDYAALGHVHNPPHISDTVRYCGFPEGRAFDEQGEGGVYIVDIDGENNVNATRKITSKIRFERVKIDADGISSSDELIKLCKAEALKYDQFTNLRIELCGVVTADGFDVSAAQELCSPSLASLQIKDETISIPDIAFLERDASLKGEFYRVIRPRLHSDDAAERAGALRALRIGLAAIEGKSFTDGGRS